MNNREDGLLTFFRGNREQAEQMTLKRRQHFLFGIAMLIMTMFGPFTFCGAVLFVGIYIYEKIEKQIHYDNLDYRIKLEEETLKRRLVILLSLVVIIYWFIFHPASSLIMYRSFPFVGTLIKLKLPNLTIKWTIIPTIISNAIFWGLIFYEFYIFNQQRKIISKDDQIEARRNSKVYRKIADSHFEIASRSQRQYEDEYQHAVAANENNLLTQLKDEIFIGVDEFGHKYVIPYKELNQHGVLVGTTGSGKTVVLLSFLDHSMKFDIPSVLVDGKGSGATRKAFLELSKRNKVEKHSIILESSQDEDAKLFYNPIKYGDSTEIRDRLINIIESESQHYTELNQILITVTIQLLKAFNWTGNQRNLKSVLYLMNPDNALNLFLEELESSGTNLKSEYEKISKKKSEKKAEEVQIIADDPIEPASPEVIDMAAIEQARNDESANKGEWHFVDNKDRNSRGLYGEPAFDPFGLSYFSKYIIIKNNMRKLKTEEQRDIFKRIFVNNAVTSDGILNYYINGESIKNQLDMLVNSEIGDIFIPKEDVQELDLRNLDKHKQHVLISLDGLKYGKYIQTIGRLLTSDLKSLASYKNKYSPGDFDILFDEAGVYVNTDMVDTVNKGRDAGFHALYATQTLADYNDAGEGMVEKIIGNVNTVILGKTNDPSEIDYWSKKFGTYRDIDKTSMTQQESGLADFQAQHWTGDRGTIRNIDRFTVNPNDIRSLATGQFFIERTVPVKNDNRKVYPRNPLKKGD